MIAGEGVALIMVAGFFPSLLFLVAIVGFVGQQFHWWRR